MNIPDYISIRATGYKDGGTNAMLINAWHATAIKIGLETGIFVNVEFEYIDNNYPYIKRIFFKILDQEAEDETSLKRLLKLKAFL